MDDIILITLVNLVQQKYDRLLLSARVPGSDLLLERLLVQKHAIVPNF